MHVRESSFTKGSMAEGSEEGVGGPRHYTRVETRTQPWDELRLFRVR